MAVIAQLVAEKTLEVAIPVWIRNEDLRVEVFPRAVVKAALRRHFALSESRDRCKRLRERKIERAREGEGDIDREMTDDDDGA